MPLGSATTEISYLRPRETMARKGSGASSHQASFRARKPVIASCSTARSSCRHQSP